MTRDEMILELLQDEETAKEIIVEDVDQTLANFKAHGIEMTADELGELCAGFVDCMKEESEGDELSDEALEDVAGGSGLVVGLFVKDVASALKGGISKGRSDKKNKSVKGMKYVEEANTPVGKGMRAIGYTIGWCLTRR